MRGESAAGSVEPDVTTAPSVRVDALDFVRGVCALAVAAYHVLGWLKVAHLHALGTYGVYAFFVISGASLALGYARRIQGTVALRKFLLARYARLLPLFGLVVLYNVLRHGVAGRTWDEIAGLMLLNLTFLFGFANPGTTSLVTGGWSLGIEFVFYLIFPLLLAALATPRMRLAVLFVSFVAQRCFVELTLSGFTKLAAAWAAYTQPLAFIAYFVFGCALGLWRLEQPPASAARTSYAWAGGSLLLLGLVFGLPNASDVEAVVGWKGTMLACATIGCVACASRVTLNAGMVRRVARYFGDISYGVYLLHPLVYANLHSVVPKRELAAHPIAWMALVLLVAALGASAVKRFVEEPVLRVARARIARIA